MSGSLNWYRNAIDVFETTLRFPTPRPFELNASTDDTWDLTVNNRVQAPGGVELQVSYIYCGARNVSQGREHARSSFDVTLQRPIMGDRAELVFTLIDVFNNFAVEQDIDGQRFTAVYQNLLETPVATVGLRYRF